VEPTTQNVEINFSILNPNKVLENEDDLTVQIYTNAFVNTTAIYVIKIMQKE
jgi:hypothetical protein